MDLESRMSEKKPKREPRSRAHRDVQDTQAGEAASAYMRTVIDAVASVAYRPESIDLDRVVDLDRISDLDERRAAASRSS
jgi:hypothetical protein